MAVSTTSRRGIAAANSASTPVAKRPAPASVARCSLKGGNAATSRGAQPGKSSNQPCGSTIAHAPVMMLGTPSTTSSARVHIGVAAGCGAVTGSSPRFLVHHLDDVGGCDVTAEGELRHRRRSADVRSS